MKPEVIEDNAGHLYLFVFRGEETIYAADGFEHFPGVLKESLEELNRTGTVEDWEPGNIEEPEAVYETLQDWINEGMGGAQLIADQDGVYPDRMGAAGMIEFGIEEYGKKHNGHDRRNSK